MGLDITLYYGLTEEEVEVIQSAYNEKGSDNLLKASIGKGYNHIFQGEDKGLREPGFKINESYINDAQARAYDMLAEIMAAPNKPVSTENMCVPMRMFSSILPFATSTKKEIPFPREEMVKSVLNAIAFLDAAKQLSVPYIHYSH